MDRRTLLLGAGAAAMVGVSGLREARADAMADAKKRGTLIIGMEAAYVPYEYFQNGKIIGYDCDIAGVLCDKLGVKPMFVDTAWAGIIPGALRRQVRLHHLGHDDHGGAGTEGSVLDALCRCQQCRPGARGR